MHRVRRPALLDGSSHDYLLRDRARLDAFAEAVKRTVREGDVVADVGTGSGILAFLAVRAGARRVFAVESHDESFITLRRNLARNGVADRVGPVHADGTRWTPPEPVDVLVCELMETGLLHEPITTVMRHAHASWPGRPRAVVPQGAQLRVDAVRLEDAFHGYHASYPGFRATGVGRAVTDQATYATYDFGKEAPPEGVDAAFTLTAAVSGRVDALRLRTVTQLTPGLTVGEGPAYCSPIILPLDEPLSVEAGVRLAGRLRYAFEYTADPIAFDLKPA